MFYLGLGLLLFGCLFTGYALNQMMIAFQSSSWDKTSAIMKRSAFVEISERLKDDSARKNHRYHLDLLYEFNIEGQNFEGTRLKFGPLWGSNNLKVIQSILDQYPQDSNVEIFYNPKNPKQCTLQNQFDWSMLVGVVVGLVFCAVGVSLLM